MYSTLVAVLVVALSGLSSALPHAQERKPLNKVIQRLQQNRPAIGTFTRTAGADLDFAVIDVQYGEFNIDEVRTAVAGMRTGSAVPVAPIVRIPYDARDAPQAVVTQLLDAGVFGVMFPDIETKEQAVTAVGSMRSRADVWPVDPAGELVAMIQIESLVGIENLDEILAVPGIGVIFLGPTDLAKSADEDGPNAPRVETLVQEVLRGCLAANIPCGYPIVAPTREAAERETARRLEEGFRVLAVMTTAR
jgi:4-hydroxy-2-oxoheptanedioate aldolase